MLDLQRTLNQVKTAADWVSLRHVTEKTTQRRVRDEKVDGNSVFFDQGVMVEVLVNGHFGFSGTSDLTESGIKRALGKAVAMARSGASQKVHNFTTAQRPATQGSYSSPILRPMDSISAKEISDVLVDATCAMKVSDKILSRSAGAMIVETAFHSVTSSGAEVRQNFSIVSTDFSATAGGAGETQTRSDGGGLARCLQIGAEVFNRADILNRSKRIAEESVELLLADNCPNETLDLLLAPDQMTLQVHESIGHPLEYDRILGDERNYAGWSFVKPEDFGKLQYGSPLMNVTFDPTVADAMASYAFDDSGLPATKEFLIQDGVLVRGLGGLESQARLNLPGVANFRSASWNRAPIDRMANINLEPGTSKFQDMIASVERGVFMMANKSWSIDDYRNKFQFGCEYAKLIENGKITKTLKNPNYRGTTVKFWNGLKAVSENRETYGSPFCGKGEPNQVIRVGHTTPYCLFANVEVFGA
ncbi:MAG: Zn-dependent protease [Bdellovibrio sp. ArHS]|uniref:TldD/PmbA family protein n=1 Tax=Bdellovibrio sp. ArHS TaxID=1569284 RepID=UPI000582C8BD|nr:TldD/PmbA family protein [Bdellovibrio sp. ArHS]KHD89817.1 MAG: Zn-dependent protease [Bdellovibrio sp. ArHS]